MTRTLLLALLHLFPHFPMRACIVRRADEIAFQANEASGRYGVSPEILMSVGFHETHLGCDPNEGGGWGAPIDRRHRHTAGTVNSAARVLANGREHCRSWRGAVSWFRDGTCRVQHPQYVSSVMSLAARMRELAAVTGE